MLDAPVGQCTDDIIEGYSAVNFTFYILAMASRDGSLNLARLCRQLQTLLRNKQIEICQIAYRIFQLDSSSGIIWSSSATFGFSTLGWPGASLSSYGIVILLDLIIRWFQRRMLTQVHREGTSDFGRSPVSTLSLPLRQDSLSSVDAGDMLIFTVRLSVERKRICVQRTVCQMPTRKEKVSTLNTWWYCHSDHC